MIEAPESVKKDEVVEVRVSIGEADPHPNTEEHHIAWIKVYFKSDEDNFPVEVGTLRFEAHGELGVKTQPNVDVRFTAEKSGAIIATSYCNIHGLWENSQELKVD